MTLPVGMLVFLLLLAVIQEGSAVLPSFTAGLDPVPLMLFVPLPLVVSLILSLESRLAAPETSGVRPIALLDAALSLAVVAAALAISGLADAAFTSPHAAAAGRNTAFLIGLMLIARSAVGQPAVMVPVAWLVVVLLFGFETGHRAHAWTIVPEPIGSLRAAIAAAATCGIGLAAQIYTSRKTA
ncbi:hypothetical protein ACLQ18_39450 [Streptomyces sp. DT193]|uniref:hypothetical protein n=1 Tax=Streptomyces sp. DT193 TaxID=3393418 RepID=UPI003CEA65EA